MYLKLNVLLTICNSHSSAVWQLQQGRFAQGDAVYFSDVHLTAMYQAGNGGAQVFSPLWSAVHRCPMNSNPLCQTPIYSAFFSGITSLLSDHGWCCWMQNCHCFQARGLSRRQHTAKHWLHPASNSSSPYSATFPALLMLLIRNELGN